MSLKFLVIFGSIIAVMVLSLFFSLIVAGAYPLTTALPTQPQPICQSNGTVLDVLTHAGVVYLAGDFTALRPAGAALDSPQAVVRTGLGACDVATGAILPWQPVITHTAALTVEHLALSGDGQSLYLGGLFSAVQGSARRNAAQVAISNAALLPWSPNPARRVRYLLLSHDQSTVFVAGGNGLLATAASSGAPSAGFAPDLRNAANNPASVHAVAQTFDGATLYLAGGDFVTVNGVARSGAAAIDTATGQTTRAFAPDLRDTNPSDGFVQIYDIYLYDRHLYLCGDWWLTEGGAANGGWGEADPHGRQSNLARFDPSSGAADRTWRPWTDGGVQGCDLDPIDERLILGGHFDTAGGESQLVTDTLAALPKAAAVDLSVANPITPAWRPALKALNLGVGIFPELWAVEVAGGRLWLGGRFDQIGGVAQQGIAALNLARTALLVVGDPAALIAGDWSIYQRLEQTLGFAVRIVADDVATASDADGVDIVLLSASSSSTILGSKFKNVSAPVLVWRPWLLDDMGMTGAPESEYGTLTGQQAQVISPDHPLAAGRTGTITLTVLADRTFTWGRPGAGATSIATMVDPLDQLAKPVFFAYPRQAILADGTSAAGCRVALPLYQNAAAVYSMDGWLWFDAAVRWGLHCPDAPLDTATATPTAIHTATPTSTATAVGTAATATPTVTGTPPIKRAFLPVVEK